MIDEMAGLVACVGEKSNPYRVLFVKTGNNMTTGKT
jgi:hypothetical protein